MKKGVTTAGESCTMEKASVQTVVIFLNILTVLGIKNTFIAGFCKNTTGPLQGGKETYPCGKKKSRLKQICLTRLFQEAVT